MMNDLTDWIDKQIRFNQSKNFFHRTDEGTLRFADSTVKKIREIHPIHPSHQAVLIDYTTEKVLEELCRINQYYAFGVEDKNELKEIYTQLLLRIEEKIIPVEEIEKEHYEKLSAWLAKTNPFAEKLYSKKEPKLQPVTCAEYNARLQMDILRINLTDIQTPVLDVGCGRKMNLVHHLRRHNIEAYGIDRFAGKQDFCENADWLQYEYGTERWGTIISNLGFSNHFHHHHLREDGDFVRYARKYMEILHALQSGGSFFYAPSLPFIEKHLPENQFAVENYTVDNSGIQATKITRLK